MVLPDASRTPRTSPRSDHPLFGNSHPATPATRATARLVDARQRRGCGCNGVQGHHRQGDPGARPFPRRCAQAHQGIELLRLLHRPGRADPRLHHRRRLPARRRPQQGGLRGCTDSSHGEVRKAIREHQLLSVRQAIDFPEWKTPNGCASAARPSTTTVSRPGRTRPPDDAEPLHQRARARQYPEGWHLFGGAAHVGRPHYPSMNCAAIANAARNTRCRRSRSPVASASTCSA